MSIIELLFFDNLPLFLPPSFMRGGPKAGGESAYLLRKYAKMPTFHRKVGTPSDPVAPGFARIHRATSPIYGGGKKFFDTLKRPGKSGALIRNCYS